MKIINLSHLITLMFQMFCVNSLNVTSLHRCNADLVIAGLFPITSANPQAQHGDQYDIDSNGVQEALAMIYTVHNINKNNNLLPNITLGVDVLDTKDQSDCAIKSCLKFDFVRTQMGKYSNSKTLAVIGLRTSSVARSIATLTHLFKIPAISYGATDHTLSDKQKFPYFVRTIPNNEQLVKATLALLNELKWTVVFVIYDRSDYGRSAFQMFKEQHAKSYKHTICVASSIFITHNNIHERIASIKSTILPKYPAVKVMVVFADGRTASPIVVHAIARNISNFTWILTAGFDAKAVQFTRTMETSDLNNTIITLYRKWNDSHYIHGFKNFVNEEVYQLYSLIPNLTHCIDKKCLYFEGFTEFFHSHLLSYVSDAVYVVAHALHQMLRCDQGECDLSYAKSDLYEYIMNTSFTNGLNYTLKFNKNGDVFGQYQLALIKKTNQSGKTFNKMFHENIGTWNSTTNQYENLQDDIRKLQDFSFFQTCKPGEEKIKTNLCPKCCNICKKCSTGKYSNVTNSHICHSCPKRFTPNQNQDGCVLIKPTFVRYNSILGIALITFSVIGHAAVLVTCRVFLKYKETHIIKASSCEVSLLMLIGAFCCYTSTYLTVGEINDFKCQMTITMSGISLSLMIGALLVKTNRVYRIFDKNILRKGLPKFLSIFWQRAIILGIIILDVSLSLAIAYYPSDNARHNLYTTDVDESLYSICYYNTNLVSAWWVFHCCLVLFCTYQAILARKVPGNYNEARNIMLAMLAISLEIIILLPSFYYESSGFHRQLVLMFINIVSATSTLCFMFLPKIYVVFFRPWENCEELPHGHMGFFLQESITSTNTLDSSSSASITSRRYSTGRKRHLKTNCCKKNKRKVKTEVSNMPTSDAMNYK